ncbi:Peptidase M1 family protein [Fulvivirga imtechensis AK7]|uniref:Peptidase M1 family protein n=1 Tax=Fulvivirga imtechensis AK7 TaxID=1237149 RepID=L8JT08_9BACT|nr:M1 family metallopeptidase [Fulvivirga imtechensis]ELR72111.1 Peptidase M1 family protein [Fulvivirga imtechensis AK7]
MNIRTTITYLLILSATIVTAQTPEFTRQDTLRGSITPERAWWDLTYYHLDVAVDPEKKTVEGKNTIQYKVLTSHDVMQIDLQEPMKIKKVTYKGKELEFQREGNVYWIKFNEKQEKGASNAIIVHFGGQPQVAKNPPWDGGFTWQKDEKGNHFIANANQGAGASIWWPCKDHMYDETDSMTISVTVPEHLMDVSNGRLIKTERNKKAKTKTYHWFVSNPINNYGVNVNIGDYVHFGETYDGEKGKLDCDYYVLRHNLEKAKIQFKDAKRTLEALEHWFGPYPFYEDSYKLVEAPYLGMEHQSSVTYGNNYQNGYKGKDLSGSGWGLTFDFIIIHESGHEWFANNITNRDNADMWIHESFTAYSENLFLDYHNGKDASSAYVLGTRSAIQNDRPIIGFYDVNHRGSSDMYYKGANVLHTLRQIVNDDEKWRGILRGLNKEFYHQTVTTTQIENYLGEKTGRDLSAFFDQYLRDTRIPTLEYRVREGILFYRWANTVSGFTMPVKVFINDTEHRLEATNHWNMLENIPENPVVEVDANFYVGQLDLMGRYYNASPK